LSAAQPCHKRAAVASRAGRSAPLAKRDRSEETGGVAAGAARARPAEDRADRLARALRENLRRRKEQARARRAAEAEDSSRATPGRRTGDG
jgi:hypothetical protein